MVLEQLKKKQDMFIITKEELGKPPEQVEKLLDFKINIKKQQLWKLKEKLRRLWKLKPFKVDFKKEKW